MRHETVSAGLLAAIAVLALARCAPVQSQAGAAPATRNVALTTPVIDSARPDSVVVPYGGVVEVTLHGTGFVPGQPGQNTVHFNSTALKQISASVDGRRIVFVIPEAISSGGSAPPSHLLAGSYSVKVESASGTSNTVKIRVYR